jgi:hypothetical protein
MRRDKRDGGGAGPRSNNRLTYITARTGPDIRHPLGHKSILSRALPPVPAVGPTMAAADSGKKPSVAANGGKAAGTYARLPSSAYSLACVYCS